MKAALIFKAGELYELGCNSSQAVCGALAGHYGLDQETAFRMASSFGDGTSRLRGTCGAADALVIMAGFEKDTSIPGDTGTREENYRMVRELVAEFKRRHGSVFCATLCGRRQDEALPEARRRRSRNLRRLPRLAVTALRRAAPERATTTAIIQIVTTKISPWIAPVILSLNRRPNTGMFSLEEGKIIRNFPDKVPE